MNLPRKISLNVWFFSSSDAPFLKHLKRFGRRFLSNQQFASHDVGAMEQPAPFPIHHSPARMA
ncbi:hypothetical protein [Rariglobus hedericola]|uniref:Uncharacterized protein n=1 Tax=Rariglobus hedericola TaxID=2597822 RepID=A0A556QEK4_9BACT|nr:hypothetical protein [Rariglobus hedericola]TSJ75083.1 hypothetical protein FPL22_16940 [Rariglobus hedericola]